MTCSGGSFFLRLNQEIFRWQIIEAARLRFRCLNWSNLVGKEVQILYGGKLIRAGRVAATSPDGTMLWLARDGILDRKLIQRTYGFELGWPDQWWKNQGQTSPANAFSSKSLLSVLHARCLLPSAPVVIERKLPGPGAFRRGPSSR